MNSLRPAAKPQSAVRRHHQTFQGILDTASKFLEQSRLQEAAVYAQVAAYYAVHEHAGVFASARCEEILVEISRLIARDWHPSPTRSGPPTRVLHVLTQAHGAGGHTRLVWRWMERDSSRVSSIALTSQGESPIPTPLLDAARRSGGDVLCLDRSHPSLFARARCLFDASCNADFVILHTHPYDVLPLVALGGSNFARPVAVLNHADHLFWLGVGLSSVVVNIRPLGESLTVRRRGVPKDRCALLPIPIDRPRRTKTRNQAKSEVGVPADAVLLLSVATGYKFGDSSDCPFLHAVEPAIEASANVFLRVVGPPEEGPWLRARERTAGRVRALGTRADVAAFYQAADIYLDSYPWGSLTSLLEAVSYGTPAIARIPSAEATVLSSDLPGMPERLYRARSVSDYRARLAELIFDEKKRRDLGDELAELVQASHGPEHWGDHLERVYRKMASREREPLSIPEKPELSELDIMLAESVSRIGQGDVEAIAVQQGLRFLPTRSRIAAWFALALRHGVADPKYLLSEAMTARLRALRPKVNSHR